MNTILIIEDDARTRKFMRAHLEATGFGVEEAADGRQGLAAFDRIAPDLVVVDIFMPNMDGLETIAELRKRSSTLGIIAMSAGGSLGPREALVIAKEMGADIALTKPFTMDTLIAAARQLTATG